MATENVIIDFIVNSQQLDKAIDQLEKAGTIDSKLANDFKKTTAEINKQAAAIKVESAQSASLKKNLDDVNKTVKSTGQTVMQAFQQGVMEGFNDALQEAGVTAEEFEQRLQDVTNGTVELEEKTVSLRTKMRLLQEQMVELKLKGEDDTDAFRALAAEAGALQDAIDDANSEIKNVASDTRNLDDLLGSAQALAGGFAAVQGATALFGDESEELQKTLLKVNAAMAIAQGIQQISLALEKEGALTRLANTIATKAQTAAQVAFNFVIGASTGLLKAFRIALAATGVGLLVLAIVELVNALNQEDDALERVNAELERNKALIDADIQSIERRTEIAIAQADLAGKAESDLVRLRGRSLIQQRQAIRDANADLIRQRDQLNNTSEAWFELNKRIGENVDEINNINQKLILEDINLQKQLAEEAKKAAEDAKKAAEEAAAKARELRLSRLNDELAAIQRQLLKAEEGSNEELRLKQQLVAKQAQIDLEGEKLTANQKLLIREQSLKDQIELQKSFNEKLVAEAIAGQISINNAELSSIKTNAEERLILQIANIELAAAQEAAAAEGNANKIKEINAKRDADIRNLRLQSLQQTLNDELTLEAAKNGVTKRALQDVVNDEKEALANRLISIDELANYDLESIDKRREALNKSFEDGLISFKDYNIQYEQLTDEQARITEEAEKKKQEIVKKSVEAQKQQQRQLIDFTIQTTQQVIGVIDQLFKLQSERELQSLNEQKENVNELREAGTITEKDAIQRLKKIDAEEKRIKQQQAQRDKQVALFQAIINTAAAIAKALPNLVLAGIAAALGAAQIALIAARPIPKFSKGKKDGYEGLGEVGETGTELIERDGRMYVVDKPQIVWLGKQDKVYTPIETKKMMQLVGDKAVINYKPQEHKPDYEKIGEAVAKEIKKIPGFNLSLDKDGFNLSIQKGLSRSRQMDKFYQSKYK